MPRRRGTRDGSADRAEGRPPAGDRSLLSLPTEENAHASKRTEPDVVRVRPRPSVLFSFWPSWARKYHIILIVTAAVTSGGTFRLGEIGGGEGNAVGNG